ncbi:hypothetical protein HMI54_005270 [Coelomomyces lativittatus]|nr:hypothetical protein HMI56_007120 [Coelomomyces lativittatus]KAJ1517528.1 hypothetical protein HMI54_005270 [Coelomomyces lativittatus]
MPPMNAEEMEKLASKVSKLIASNQVTVFSKTYCPYCTNAKNAFRKLGKEFKAIELDEEKDGDAIQSYLLQLTGQRTVPNIFVKGKHIGGCSDLLALIDAGKLEALFT